MTDDTCPATNRNGEPCGLSTGWGVEGTTEGPCKFHGGATPTKDENPDVGNGDQDGNGNAETHSLRSDPGPYYDRQSESEQERIDEWAGSWARRGGYGGLGFDKLFHTHAVKLHQVERADKHIGDEGTIISRVVDRTESGEAIVQDEENPAFLLQSRAIKDITRFLKEMGCLDDPDSQQANATESVAAVLGEQ